MCQDDLVRFVREVLAPTGDGTAPSGVCTVTRIYVEGQLIEATVSLSLQTYELALRERGGV